MLSFLFVRKLALIPTFVAALLILIMRPFKLLTFLFCLSLIVTACKEKPKPTPPPPSKRVEDVDLSALYDYYVQPPVTQRDKEVNTLIDYAADQSLPVVQSPRGIFYYTEELGKGNTAKWGDPIKVHYKGYTIDGQTFDSSYDRGKPFSFRVGNAIAGWNEILQILPAGSKATLLIPSELAYGTEGFSDIIAPDTPLLFDIHIQ